MGYQDIVEFLEETIKRLETPESKQEMTPICRELLTIAVTNGDVDMAKFIIDNKSSIQ